MEKINSRDISVVVQGSIDPKITPLCLNSIRKYLPEAELILSTWEKENVNRLNFDILLLNKDPGFATMDSNKSTPCNLNRLLVSTQEGIKKSSRKYILKIRSDCILKSNKFLKYWNRFTQRENSYSLTQHKIITSSLYSIWGEYGIKKEKGKIHPTPYHISDWWHFGLKEDIQKLFFIPLVNIEKFANFFHTFPKNNNYEINWLNHRLWKYPPEQYLGSSFAKKIFKNLKFDNCLDYINIDLQLSERFMIDNFIFLDYRQSGILLQKKYYKTICKKFWKIPPHVFLGMYRYFIYKKKYNLFYKKNFLQLPDFEMFFYKLIHRNIL